MSLLFRFLLFWFLFASQMVSAGPRSPRIISLVPSQTELIFALGFGEKVVGISDFCNFPSEVASLPRVGGQELNLEKLISLRPTIIVDLGGMHRKYELFFNQVGLNYKNFVIDSFSQIPSAAVALASDLDSPSAAKHFLALWEDSLSKIPSRPENPKKVYVEIWDTPLQAAGPNSFLGEMIERAGGVNILPHSKNPYPVINSEQIVLANPEIILVAYPVQDLEKILSRGGWSDIAAVRKKNIFRLDYDRFVRPGPRAIEALKFLSDLINSVN